MSGALVVGDEMTEVQLSFGDVMVAVLEMMFVRGETSLWMRNVQLTLFTIPVSLA